VKSLGTSTGQYLAKYITDKLSGKATVGILQCDRLGVGCSDRVAGLKESLSTLPGVQYAADQEGFMADASTPVAQAILSAHPDINILWAENEGGTVGEVTAVRSANRAGKVFVFGTDITPQIAQFLLDPDGILVASTGQSPEAMGQQAIQGALTVIHGQTISPLVSYTPVTLYTRDNPADVQAYIAAHPAK
jgi:ABC-type sugar transport system substrate-binding protein